MSRRHIRLMVLSVLVVAFTAIGAVVFAEWLATGTGEGSAAAGTAVELRVEPVAGVGGDAQLLVPGGTGDVEAVIVNDNPYDVEVRTITQDGPITSNQAGCDETTGEVTYATQTGSWIVPADGDLSVRLTDALAMGIDAADECQGAEFTVPLAVTGGNVASTTTTTSPIPIVEIVWGSLLDEVGYQPSQYLDAGCATNVFPSQARWVGEQPYWGDGPWLGDLLVNDRNGQELTVFEDIAWPHSNEILGPVLGTSQWTLEQATLVAHGAPGDSHTSGSAQVVMAGPCDTFSGSLSGDQHWSQVSYELAP